MQKFYEIFPIENNQRIMRMVGFCFASKNISMKWPWTPNQIEVTKTANVKPQSAGARQLHFRTTKYIKK